MKLSRNTSIERRPRTPMQQKEIPEEWRWHYRTLLSLRDHLIGGAGDRLREPVGPMEPPSFHAEVFVDERYDRELAEALPRHRVEALREIEDALERLTSGRYGRCEATGQPIPKSQLFSRPWRRVSESAENPD